MSVPSQKDVNMMANLMKVMNGETVKLQEETTSTNPKSCGYYTWRKTCRR